MLPKEAPAGEDRGPVDSLAPVTPHAEPPARSPQFEEALRRILGDKEARKERVVVKIPPEVENGNIVPYTLNVTPSESDGDDVVRLHLLSTRNPNARVASFQFSPLTGKSQVTGRMRLARSQDVVAVAETSGGVFLIGQQAVKVDIGGCATE